MKIVEISNANEYCNLTAASALPEFNPRNLENHAADVHLVLINSAGEQVARCSLWWRKTPVHSGHQTGVIGHYAADCFESGKLILTAACQKLAQEGCALAVGPMDGNTWRSYRYIVEGNGEPAFFLEPQHPLDWLEHYLKNGFSVLTTYYSSLNTDLEFEDKRVARVKTRLKQKGITLRPLDMSDFENELRRIHKICTISFRKSFFYSPVSESEFLDQYRAVKGHLEPELIWIAVHAKETVGFVFMIPDFSQVECGQNTDTVIIKSFAVLPGRIYAGLGGVLIAQGQLMAHKLGFRRAIHAMMHESNMSFQLSHRYAKPFRRYALFARPLTGHANSVS